MIDAVEDLARRFAAVAEIHRRLVRPLDVAVVGVPSSGRRTLVRALHSTTSASTVVVEPSGDIPRRSARPDAVPDVDVSLYLLVGRVRAGDAAAVAALPSKRRIVVLNKADTCGPAAAGNDAAYRCADLLGVDVVPMSGLWAATTVTSDDASLLRHLADEAVSLPRFAARFAEGDPRRAELLTRIGWQGIADCVAAVRAGRIAGNPADFDLLLRRRSGLGDLTAALARTSAPVREFRAQRGLAELSALAARSHGQLRDAIEAIVIGSRECLTPN